MSRRTHKKSRNGCIECKRRHIKCDERWPVCSNCLSSERQCDFVGLPLPEGSSPSTSHEFTSPSPATNSPAQNSTPHLTGFSDDAPVNMLHVELFYHIVLESTNWIDTPDLISEVSFPDLLRGGMNAPYLMNALLAFSALHLSIVKPERRDFYRHHASQLQTYALNSFNRLPPQIDEDTCIPAFLFAAVLGLYLLCDTLVFREGNFEVFLDRFVQYVSLHQGVRTIAADGRWDILQQTALKPFLKLNMQILLMHVDFGPICKTLIERIQASETNEARLQIYREAVHALQSVMTAIDTGSSRNGGIGALVAWPVLVPREYVKLVAARQGEALVILAHYGALIHPSREKWMFQDGGEFLIKSVRQYLGPSWQEWLGWPLGMLAETNSL
ncbi:hypothetical protein N7510_008272 [Penicillium lagena]|uniref:uncharacterized protein n=1 Tax=Penicillium lagena TaxID=94218 RepID=UPI002540B45D|nr:uncharacterized protein N7510_008272 [Penicillium lagena]KAJ5605491.1 hypothetical protein N7510_008272 [Penicillium lagena]